MNQAKPARVQRLAWKLRADGHAACAAAIHRIANQRVPDGGHVHANLVRSAGFQGAFDQRAIDESFDDAVVRARRLAGTDHRHFRPLRRMPADRLIDRAARFEHAAHERLIIALDRSRL